MKVSMLTFSQTGNTLKVGNSIAEGMRNNGFEVDHVRFLHRKKWNPDDADVIGIGGPCYESRPAEPLLDFIKDYGSYFSGKKAFVFITSSSSPAKTLWRLAQSVAEAGATIIGGVQIIGVSTAPTMFGLTPNRPNQDDMKYAEAFGKAIANAIIYKKELPDKYGIDPNRGSKFYDQFGLIANYVKKKMIPPPVVDTDKCTLCGNCVYECPTNNITVKNKTIQIGHDCTVCWRCWHVCPRNAISMKVSPGEGLFERLVWSEKMENIFEGINPDIVRGENLYKDAIAQKIKLKYNRKNPTAEYGYVE